ncbi:MAG: hypothetical protein N2662_09295 [Bacteroidales bacterium]|nr:hypothetical protein [Bacteroidales bacterium]
MIQHFQFNVRQADAGRLIEKLKDEENVIVIRTCWRLEIYRGEGYVSEAIVRHLYRVVSGLDSPVLGDGAVQNQVKSSYLQACKQNKFDKFMHRLFQSALHTGKLVRSKTNIAKGSVSYANAIYHIVAYAEQISKNNPIAIVGINEITRNVCKFLLKKGYRHIKLFNRSLSRAEKLGNELHVSFGGLDELRNALEYSNVLIAAAASPETIIPANYFSSKPYCIVDVGVPPNVDNTIIKHKDMVYYGIDKIENYINQSFSFRQKETAEAESIIEEQVAEFMQWQERELMRFEMYRIKNYANI